MIHAKLIGDPKLPIGNNQCTRICRLVELMQPIECKINLIMFNPHQGTRFTASDMKQVEAFRAIIMQVMPTMFL